MIFAGAGHRPDKLAATYYEYDRIVRPKLVDFARRLLERGKPSWVISGGAIGWDQALARAALDLDIPYTFTIPFLGQESRWPIPVQKHYRMLVDNASEVVIVCDGGYSPRKMQARNEYMVNQLGKDDYLLALWNGSPGGTRNTVLYAERTGKRVVNVWSRWLEFLRHGDF